MASRVPRALRSALPHIVLTMFSLMILLPLLWIVRVSLTDKLTAYKIPPEIGTLGLFNYADVFVKYNFLIWFMNSAVVALAATAISLPLATALAYAFDWLILLFLTINIGMGGATTTLVILLALFFRRQLRQG